MNFPLLYEERKVTLIKVTRGRVTLTDNAHVILQNINCHREVCGAGRGDLG